MSEAEQNKRINQLRRQLANAVERIKTLELDMEPNGRISEGFTAMENHIDEQFEIVHRRFERLEHQFNRLQAKMEVILEAITGLGDLPEDETN
jgi:chaperonin cofactor prefoldin